MKNRFLLTGATLLAALLVACGGGGSGGTPEPVRLAVTLDEWSIVPEREVLTEAEVTFAATNQGSVPHELMIVKTDLPPHLLDVVDGNVDETQVNVVDEIEPFAPGETLELSLYMSPGKYLLICNIVERPPGQDLVSHYENGMVAALIVDPIAATR